MLTVRGGANTIAAGKSRDRVHFPQEPKALPHTYRIRQGAKRERQGLHHGMAHGGWRLTKAKRKNRKST